MRYKKKPVVIEAVEWVGSNWNEVCDFLGVPENGHGHLESEDNMQVIIRTLEGDMTADQGDYIIKGVNGEFYPCKPDIFEKTYDKVD